MRGVASVFGFIFLFVFVTSQEDGDRLVDPASRVLPEYKKRHPKPALLTTISGKPVEIRETNNFNSELITNTFFMGSIKHLVFERIPEREVLSKGTGAHGYFEVTHDITQYTKAKVFEKIGKKTPLFARFAVGQVDKGGIDATPLGLRGLSLKIYTEEGNLDFLNINIPVYVYRDPLLFPSAVRALRKSPKTYLTDITSTIDFVTLNPQTIHGVLWLASEFGLPRGYRRMNVFPIHTYEIYNEQGESFFVRFKFLSELGFDSLSLQEARNISAIDPDFFMRDLYNSIERKNYPTWKVEMDILTEKDIEKANFNPFDVVSLWPNGTYITETIGRVVLNRNVDNFFRTVEQSAFSPANLVPGIRGPPDLMFKGRVVAYADAHIHRLGINHNNIEINCPMYHRTYDRDGLPPVLDNMKDAPNYFPNSFNGPEAYVDESLVTRRIMPLETHTSDFEQAKRFYNSVLTKKSQKKQLIDNLTQLSLRVEQSVIDKFAELLQKVDEDLAKRYTTSVAIAKRTVMLPSSFDDIPKPKKG